MAYQDATFFNPHFHLEEASGVLVLLLGNSAPIDETIMKDILRAVHRMDPIGGMPILVQQDELVRMSPEAKTFLARTCDSRERPVAFMAYDLPDRIQGDFFPRFHKPRFPFRVFSVPEEAQQWFAKFTTTRFVPR